MLKKSKWLCAPNIPDVITDRYLTKEFRGFTDENLKIAPVKYFRRVFHIESLPHKSSELLITALGCYSVRINGWKISPNKLSPGFTNYHTTVYAQQIDISSFLRIGQNEIVVALSDGWFSGYVGYGLKAKISGLGGHNGKHYWGDTPAFNAQIKIGDNEIRTDEWWKCSLGEIVESDILMGERHDTRLIGHYNWSPVKVCNPPENLIVETTTHPPIVVMRYIDAIHMGGGIYDLGENIAGVVEVVCYGDAGDEVVVRHSEILTDGKLDTNNLRCARSVDSYILHGKSAQLLLPEFTYHGFRYIQIETPAHITNVRGVVLSTNMEYYDITFEDSEATQLFENIQRTQQSNFMDIPTDCPQRDERLGWSGDIQLYLPTAMKISNCRTFFEKWLKDLNDSQWDDGEYPAYAPTPYARDFERGGAGWSDAGMIVPYLLYMEYHSDKVWQFYPNMLKYMEWRYRRDPMLVGQADIGKFGDWLGLAETPSELIDICYHHYSCEIMSKFAEDFGDRKLSTMFDERATTLKKNFSGNYIIGGRLINETQTAYVLALKFRLISRSHIDQLVELIHKDGGTLTTGFLGSAYILEVLSENGYHQLALDLFYGPNSRWLTPVRRGATTVWERWDSDTSVESMNSYSHFAFGSVGNWMVEYLNNNNTNHVEKI